MLDAQVTADAAAVDLGLAHRRKASCYSTEAIYKYVWCLSRSLPVVSTLTWQGAAALASFYTWDQLRLSRSDFTILTVQVLEESCKIHQEFQRMSGRPHP